MPINNTPIPGLNTELHKCSTNIWHDLSGRGYKDSELLQLLYDQDQADELTAQMYVDHNGKMYSASQALLHLVSLYENGVFEDCNLPPAPFARMTISLEIEETGTCLDPSAIRYGYSITDSIGTIIADTRTTPDTLSNVNNDLPNVIENGFDGDFCGNPMARTYATTVTALTTADRFRINGGADLLFIYGNSSGHTINKQILEYHNTTPIPGIEAINISIFDFHIRISTTTVTSIEYFNTTTGTWVAFEQQGTDYDNKCFGCYTITPYSTNCDGTGNATTEGGAKAVSITHLNMAGGGDLIFGYENVFQIYSPYNAATLGPAQSPNTARILLSNDPAKPLESVIYDVSAVDDDSANTYALCSGIRCDTLPSAVNAQRGTGLLLVYDSLLNTPVLSNDLAAWNTFFNTAVNATTPFNAVTIVDNCVLLSGCIGLTIAASLFDGDTHIISISDNTPGGVISVGDTAFDGATSLFQAIFPYATAIGVMAMNGCSGLETLYAPNAVNIQSGAFANCGMLTDVYINGCTGTLGGTALDDNVFLNCGVVAQIWVSAVQQTINAGSPDGDLTYIAGLVPTVTINYV